MAWTKEPEKCIHCKSRKPMEMRHVCLEGVEADGWICDDCGWFHYYDVAYAMKLEKKN